MHIPTSALFMKGMFSAKCCTEESQCHLPFATMSFCLTQHMCDVSPYQTCDRRRLPHTVLVWVTVFLYKSSNEVFRIAEYML